MNRTDKKEAIEVIQERLSKRSSAICVDFLGVNVEQISRFRQELRSASGEYQVVKNTLARRAVAGTPFENLTEFLVGPTGIVFCPEDAANVAKVVTKFAEEGGKGIVVKGGLVEGAVLNADGIKQVSKLPPRQELLSQLVSSLQSPLSGLVNTLEGVTREFVLTLEAVAAKRASEEA